jgi:hypothetical protein
MGIATDKKNGLFRNYYTPISMCEAETRDWTVADISTFCSIRFLRRKIKMRVY